jgi:hypothetical protein
VSLPEELAETVGRIARERGTTRSGLIAAWAAAAERERQEALMAEGYRAMADEDRALAEAAFPAAAEVMRRHPAP